VVKDIILNLGDIILNLDDPDVFFGLRHVVSDIADLSR
jgi:hypothetical protein